jgi:hypothetical protein
MRPSSGLALAGRDVRMCTAPVLNRIEGMSPGDPVSPPSTNKTSATCVLHEQESDFACVLHEQESIRVKQRIRACEIMHDNRSCTLKCALENPRPCHQVPRIAIAHIPGVGIRVRTLTSNNGGAAM